MISSTSVAPKDAVYDRTTIESGEISLTKIFYFKNYTIKFQYLSWNVLIKEFLPY